MHWTGMQVSHKTSASKSPGQRPENLCYQQGERESELALAHQSEKSVVTIWTLHAW